MFNLQDDVVGIMDSAGTVIGNYTYDAWGNPITLPSSGSLLERNPFRYRGYMYDTETGLYYLQSRYYDPATGRFINADGQLNIESHILGANLSSYCYNSPVNYIDIDGKSPVTIIFLTGLMFIMVADIMYDITAITLNVSGDVCLAEMNCYLAQALYDHDINGNGGDLSEKDKKLMLDTLQSSAAFSNKISNVTDYIMNDNSKYATYITSMEFTKDADLDLYLSLQ